MGVFFVGNRQKDSDITWLFGPLYCSECENDGEFQDRCARSMSINHASSLADRRFSTPGLKSALKSSNSSNFNDVKSRLAKSMNPSSSSTNLVRFDTHVEKIIFQAEYPTRVRSWSNLDHPLTSDSVSAAEQDGFLDDVGSMMQLIRFTVQAFTVQAFMAMLFAFRTKSEYRGDTRILASLVRYCRTLFSIIVVTASFTQRMTFAPSYQYRRAWKHRARVSKRTIRFE